MTKRTGVVERNTRETQIAVSLNLDGTGKVAVETGIGFMDHMLELLGRHSLADLTIRAKGDLPVDYHHTVEDLGLALGTALDKALDVRKGIRRYGWCLMPMDDTLTEIALDLGGRPFLVYNIANRTRRIRDFDVRLIEEFFRAFTVQARLNLHINNRYGADPHHVYESVFKGLARALRQAVEADPRETGIPSSKGIIV